jgi:ABC-type lipoprotein release transport system permease subunit
VAAVWARARAELRSGWRRGIGLALLIGLIAGAALAAAAGARRTDSALDRFNRHYLAADVLWLDDGSLPSGVNMDEVARHPLVAAAARARYTYAITNEGLVAPDDDNLGRRIARSKLLSGRLARPDRADEVTVAFDAAKRQHLRVGSAFPIVAPSYPAATQLIAEHPEADLKLHVVGIVAVPGALPPSQPGAVTIYGTPALYRFMAANEGVEAVQSHRDVEVSPDSVLLRLKHGQRDVTALRQVFPQVAGQHHQLQNPQLLDGGARRSIHLQAQALWLLAALLTLAAVLVFAQTLSRFMALEASDGPRLKALGMTADQVWAIGMIRAVAIALAAAVIAVVVAVVLSPLTPIRLARTIEPRPGVYVDVAALGVGFLAIAVIVPLLSAWPAWRASRATDTEDDIPERASVLAGAVARAGMPPAIVAGTRMALESGRGRTSVPVRSTVLGAALALAALVAALTFGTSLAHLVGTPRLYGAVWDVRLTNYGGNGGPADDLAQFLDDASRQRGVAAIADGSVPGATEVGGRDTGLIVVQGSLQPPLLSGRHPSSPDEAALGAKTMQRLGAHVGSTVDIRGFAQQRVRYRIVGKVVVPADADSRLGEGVMLSGPGLARAAEGSPFVKAQADSLFVRFAPGANRNSVVDSLSRLGGGLDDLQPPKPNDVVNFGGIQALPFVLAGILGVLGVATMTHLLASAVRRRRRDLAILKTLGFSRGQITAAVLWQSALLAAVALVIGVPLGVGVGRWLWTFFATQLGVVVEPRIPVPAVLLVIPAAIVLAGLVAAVPARVASLVKPALVLRTE